MRRDGETGNYETDGFAFRIVPGISLYLGSRQAQSTISAEYRNARASKKKSRSTDLSAI